MEFEKFLQSNRVFRLIIHLQLFCLQYIFFIASAFLLSAFSLRRFNCTHFMPRIILQNKLTAASATELSNRKYREIKT